MLRYNNFESEKGFWLKKNVLGLDYVFNGG